EVLQLEPASQFVSNVCGGVIRASTTHLTGACCASPFRSFFSQQYRSRTGVCLRRIAGMATACAPGASKSSGIYWRRVDQLPGSVDRHSSVRSIGAYSGAFPQSPVELTLMC